MISLAQLYVHDVPQLRPPGQTDLLQVLWCPFDHDHDQKPYPKPALFWRSATLVDKILAIAPEPTAVQFEGYVPEPCLLDPEQVTEYPSPLALDQDLQDLLQDPNTWEAAGVSPDFPEEFYPGELSVAPGWKVGGWPRWGYTDPIEQSCPACAAKMEPLLSIAWKEWDDASRSWIPYEDQANAVSAAAGIPSSAHPTMVEPAGAHTLQLYACPVSPNHPHTELIQ